MTSPLEAFWRGVAASSALEDSRREWENRFGAAHQFARPLLRRLPHDRPAERWPCGHGLRTCRRRLERVGTGLVAYCEQDAVRCRSEDVSEDEAQVYSLDLRHLERWLQEAAGLDDRSDLPPSDARWCRLGQRRVGGTDLRVYFHRQPGERTLVEAMLSDERLGVGFGVHLLTTPALQPLKVEPGERQALLHLPDKTTWVDGRLVLDLDELFQNHRRHWLDADPRALLSAKKRLILRPSDRTVWWQNDIRSQFRPDDRAWSLLMALAQRANQPLVGELEYAKVFGYEEGDIQQLRNARAKAIGRLRKRLADPIETCPGGYKLLLEPAEVAIWD